MSKRETERRRRNAIDRCRLAYERKREREERDQRQAQRRAALGLPKVEEPRRTDDAEAQS